MKTLWLGLCLAAFALPGCQTAEQAQARYAAHLETAAAAFTGRTVGDFMRANPQFNAVGNRDMGATRVFVLETDPVIVTTTLPPHAPAPRRYNNPAMGGAFNNLNAAMNTVPAVSRSAVLVCRVTIEAKPVAGANTPDSWQIVNMIVRGQNC